uniref:Pyrin domain-containing protein n=1 Tax=Paramormyrops kingsleyae TaxID=1676925 RepID=A0A3B3TGA0_9TELE
MLRKFNQSGYVLDDELKRFKFHLNTQVLQEFQPIPVSQLERADRMDTVKKMKDYYNTEGALRVTHAVLKKMEMNDLAKKVQKVMNMAITASAILGRLSARFRSVYGNF